MVPISIILGLNNIDISWIPGISSTPGEGDTWITFWGTYLGALIGALTVYYVTTSQMKQQSQDQFNAIKQENQSNYNRELAQYYFRLELEKIEEMYTLIEVLTTQYVHVQNRFTHLIISSEALAKNNQINNARKEIFEIRNNYFSDTNKLLEVVNRLDMISKFIPELKHRVQNIKMVVVSNVSEFRNALYKDYVHQDYIEEENGESKPFEESLQRLQSEIKNIKSTLNEKYEQKIIEMKEKENSHN